MMKKACNFVEYIAAIYKVTPAYSVLEVQCTDKMMYYCLCDIHIFAQANDFFSGGYWQFLHAWV